MSKGVKQLASKKTTLDWLEYAFELLPTGIVALYTNFFAHDRKCRVGFKGFSCLIEKIFWCDIKILANETLLRTWFWKSNMNVFLASWFMHEPHEKLVKDELILSAKKMRVSGVMKMRSYSHKILKLRGEIQKDLWNVGRRLESFSQERNFINQKSVQFTSKIICQCSFRQEPKSWNNFSSAD